MNTSIEREQLENGRCMPAKDVVAADLIALVSGVNLASVNKLVHALNIVSKSLGIPYDQLLSSSDLPRGRADATRLQNTERLASVLTRAPYAIDVEPEIHFIGRMARRK